VKAEGVDCETIVVAHLDNLIMIFTKIEADIWDIKFCIGIKLVQEKLSRCRGLTVQYNSCMIRAISRHLFLVTSVMSPSAISKNQTSQHGLRF
jgi:hypothetical protein